MILKENIIRYINAGYPILYVNTYEEIKFDGMLNEVTEATSKKIMEWNGADGLVDFKTKLPLVPNDEITLENTLRYINSGDDLNNHILVLKDAHMFLNETHPDIISLLKRICQKIQLNYIDGNIIIVSTIVNIPIEIEKFVTVFEMDDMSSEDIKSYIYENLDDDYTISSSLLNEMALAFKGLSEYEIDSLINLSISENGEISRADLKLIAEQKRQIIKKTNILEMINVREKIADVGGLESLKKWLNKKSKVYKNIDKAMKFGVDMPKGVLIAGIPGCGKSLCAKVTSALFEVPLLKLDMGKIMGKYLGESETNMRKAIKLAENISPCVLWIDELEKAFAGIDGSGHEVTLRLFATFLTWLQEKETPVFVVATANDISKLPPELLRKGRFDEIFFVDLPNDSERRNVFNIHISKRRKSDLDSINIAMLAKETKGFSSADIEAVVVDAVESSFADDKSCLTTEYLIDAIKRTKSLSVLMKDKLDELRKFYTEKSTFKSAT